MITSLLHLQINFIICSTWVCLSLLTCAHSVLDTQAHSKIKWRGKAGQSFDRSDEASGCGVKSVNARHRPPASQPASLSDGSRAVRLAELVPGYLSVRITVTSLLPLSVLFNSRSKVYKKEEKEWFCYLII